MTSVGAFPASRLFPPAGTAFNDHNTFHGEESDDALRLLFDGLDEAAILLQGELIIYANPAAECLFDGDQATLIGAHLSKVLDEIAHENLYLYLRESAATETSLKHTSAIRGHSGIPMQVDVRCFPVRGMQGTHILFIRGRREAAAETHLQSQLSLNDLPCGALRLGSDLRYLHGNPALAEISAIFRFAAVGKTVVELNWPAPLRLGLEHAMEKLSRVRESQRCRLDVGSEQAALGWWATVIPHNDGNGRMAAATFLFDAQPASPGAHPEDESLENRLQHERIKREEAVAAAQARDAFFGWVSHELRTPMNGIQSWAHILETYVNASSSSPLAQKALSGIRRGIAQQLQLVDELLDVSRVMEGKLTLSKQGFFLNPVLQEAMENVQAAALAAGVRMSCHTILHEEKISGDPCRVQQMVRLLLTYLISESGHGSTIDLNVRAWNRQAIIRLHSSGSLPCVAREADSSQSARMSRPAKPCRKEVDAFLVRRLTELQGGKLEYEYANGAPLPVITLTLPLHIPAKRHLAQN